MVQGVEYDQKGCFLRALELDPKIAIAWYNLGASCGGGMVQGVEHDEKECFVRALELDPKYADAWVNLGAACGGAGCRGLSTIRRGAF